MLRRIKLTVFAAIAGLLALPATGATALSVTFGGTDVLKGDSGSVATSTPGGISTVDFGWDGTVITAYSEFTVNDDFTLTFSDYTPADGPDRSGFQLFSGAFMSGGSGMTPLFAQTSTNGTGGTASCGPALNDDFGTTQCVLVTGEDNGGGNLVLPGTTYEVTGSETYTLAFVEGTQPDSGTAQFTISAVGSSAPISAVPLPAGGLLLLSALGGVAMLRRRRKAA